MNREDRSTFLEAMREAQAEILVNAAFYAERECEHRQHVDLDGTDYHAGSASWYLQIKCLECDYTIGVVPVCTRWKNYIKSGGLIKCRGCLDVTDHKVLVLEPIKKG